MSEVKRAVEVVKPMFEVNPRMTYMNKVGFWTCCTKWYSYAKLGSQQCKHKYSDIWCTFRKETMPLNALQCV